MPPPALPLRMCDNETKEGTEGAFTNCLTVVAHTPSNTQLYSAHLPCTRTLSSPFHLAIHLSSCSLLLGLYGHHTPVHAYIVGYITAIHQSDTLGVILAFTSNKGHFHKCKHSHSMNIPWPSISY